MNFIVIYITHKNKKEAKKVAEALLRDRLIACVNYFPIESSYWWKEEIVTAKEIVTLVKTKKENWTKVKKVVEAIHPYETPCIMKLDAESNTSYAQWIKNETE